MFKLSGSRNRMILRLQISIQGHGPLELILRVPLCAGPTAQNRFAARWVAVRGSTILTQTDQNCKKLPSAQGAVYIVCGDFSI